MVPKYQVPKFLEFYASYAFPDAKSKHTADVALAYYHYAYYQMISFGETYTEFFEVDNPGNGEVMFYLRKSWSYAFGMYTLLRTTIEAINVMRKMIGDTNTVDTYYQKSIKEIIDIANDIVKHPTFKYGGVSEACEPQALSMNGEIDIVVWSDSGNPSKIELNPMKDFYTITNYCEYIAEKVSAN